MISVALIDDNRLVCDGLTALLGQVQDVEVVAAMTVPDTSRLKELRPRVVLLDFGLENGDSLALAREVKKELPETNVIVMDLLPCKEDIVDIVHAGVSGFIMKDATLEDLTNTIKSVAEGISVLPPELTSTLFSQIAEDTAADAGAQAMEGVRLTPREREVIELISEGLSNKRIAAELHISVHTVKSHVRNVMEKLALHTRLQIAAWAHHDESE